MKKILSILLISLFLLSACTFGTKTTTTSGQNELNKQIIQEKQIEPQNVKNIEEQINPPQNLRIREEKTNCPPIFNYEFTDFSKIDAFQPIGSISGASRGRSYINVKKGESVPVYAPMDATLVSIIYAYRGPEADHGEYGLKFDTKCGIIFLFDHLDSVSEEIKKHAPAEPSRSTATNDNLAIPIKVGTLLGYTDGTPQARTFDFLVIDQTKKAYYINPERWKWEQSLYSVCPYDLYTQDLKEKYYQKIGVIYNDGFKKAKNCGNPSHDVENTISGGWFLNEQSTDTKGEFMLIGETMSAVDVVVKTDSEGTLLRITDNTPEKVPRDIGIGESVCYKGFNNDWAYLNLIDGKTIELASGQGQCPTSFPQTNSKKYYR
ncbi:MAG: hypothetical protein AABX19_02805 [Nanoarchaeota archaeon]